MKKNLVRTLLVAFMCVCILSCLFGCDVVEKVKGIFVKDNGEEQPQAQSHTLATVGYYYSDDEKPMESFVTLDQIYFPKGLLETGLGLFIYDAKASTVDDEVYVRTNTEEGKKLFDKTKPTYISVHGMGWNGDVAEPHLYSDEYNVLCFQWGAFADEPNEKVVQIINKIWLEDFEYKDTKQVAHRNNRWENDDEVWEEKDVSNHNVAEMFGAFYYDFFSAFPDYSGSEIHVFGHSYGGNLSIALTSLLTTAFRCKLIPAYMLPDKVTMLDPFFSKSKPGYGIPWLGELYNKDSNIARVAYETSLTARELGITIRMFRISRSVATAATLTEFDTGTNFTEEYWNFVNSIVYAHSNMACVEEMFSFSEYWDKLHNYGWDWFTDYYTGTMLYDNSATTKEEALCMKMSYEASFARNGIKYDVDFNGTLDCTDDDIISSFYHTYTNEELGVTNDISGYYDYDNIDQLQGNAKIAGFVYYDRNGNGKMDERVGDHFQGATVKVTDASGNVMLEQTTKINGYYEIEVTANGTYTVTVTLPDGYELSENVTATRTATITDAKHQLVINNFGVNKE